MSKEYLNCILFGCGVPAILGPIGNKKDHFEVIGETYVVQVLIYGDGALDDTPTADFILV